MYTARNARFGEIWRAVPVLALIDARSDSCCVSKRVKRKLPHNGSGERIRAVTNVRWPDKQGGERAIKI